MSAAAQSSCLTTTPDLVLRETLATADEAANAANEPPLKRARSGSASGSGCAPVTVLPFGKLSGLCIGLVAEVAYCKAEKLCAQQPWSTAAH